MLSGEFSTSESAVRRASGQVSGARAGGSTSRARGSSRPRGRRRPGMGGGHSSAGGGFTWARSGSTPLRHGPAGLESRFGRRAKAGPDESRLIARSDRFGKAVRRRPARLSRHGGRPRFWAGSAASAAPRRRGGPDGPFHQRPAPRWCAEAVDGLVAGSGGRLARLDGDPAIRVVLRADWQAATGSRSSPAAARATSRPMRASSGGASSPRRCAATCSPRPPSMRCWRASWR